MFDGIFLNKIKNEIKFLETGRISKIIEIGNNDYIFLIRRDKKNYNLLMSFSPSSSRIHLTNRLYDNISPKSFTIFLKKHIEGYIIDSIDTHESDRIMIFKLKGFTELGDYNIKYLYSEFMGRYSNLILTDQNNKILDSLKHDGIGEYNRTILPNAYYTFIETDKINPLDLNIDELNNILKNIDNPRDLVNKFNGVSNLLANYVFINDDTVNNFYNILHSNIKPSIIENENNKSDYYFNDLNLKIIKEFDSLSLMLDEFYYENDLKSNIKSKTNDLSNFVLKQLNKHEKKLVKLLDELDKTKEADIYKLYGELLLSIPNNKDRLDEINVLNYYDNSYINIPLDKKYNIIDNSNKYYKKYQKIKNSIKYINEQIDIVKNEIEYFKILKAQLEFASLNEAIEIQDELINNKYLFNVEIKKNKRKEKPKILTYEVDDALISVGKNNLQNEYITHKLSKPNDMWFHVKGAPGSHVVIHNVDELNENEIRTCAILAAYYSSYSNSSSVAVDYTRIKYIKKIPGKRQCFVTYSHESTIYVDPNIDFILNLKVKK